MEDDQQFCLRWNNHQSTLIQNFDTLLESGTLVDCTLAAEGKYLKAHKVVLSACSPYFEGLLSEHYDKHPVFILKDVKFKELKAMMDYMYRGEVNISQDQLTALLKAAESLQIKGLSDNNRPQTQQPATGKAENTRPAKTASSTVAPVAADIPHASSGLTIEKNSSKVPRTSMQQVNVSDLPEDSASPQLRGLSSREGSQSPTRKRKRLRRRSLGNDDTNSMENHEASNSSDVNISAPALGVAPVAEEKTHADPADSIGRSALMQQLTKPAEEMLQMPVEKPEPSDEMIQPKSEYLDDQESVEDLTNLDDDMNDLNEMEQDNSRAGPSSHDPSQHPGLTSWHMAAGDRSNASVVGAAAGPPGAQDEVFLAAHEAAQAQRDSQGLVDVVTNRSPSKVLPKLVIAKVVQLNGKVGLVEKSPEPSSSPDDKPARSLAARPKSSLGLPRRRAGRPKRYLSDDDDVVIIKHRESSVQKKESKETKRQSAPASLKISKEPKRQQQQQSTAAATYKETKRQQQYQQSAAATTYKESKHQQQQQQQQQLAATATAPAPPGTGYACLAKGCGRIYRYIRSLQRHQRYECQVPPGFMCPHCHYRTYLKSNIRQHIAVMHKGMEVRVLHLKENINYYY